MTLLTVLCEVLVFHTGLVWGLCGDWRCADLFSGHPVTGEVCTRGSGCGTNQVDLKAVFCFIFAALYLFTFVKHIELYSMKL